MIYTGVVTRQFRVRDKTYNKGDRVLCTKWTPFGYWNGDIGLCENLIDVITGSSIYLGVDSHKIKIGNSIKGE